MTQTDKLKDFKRQTFISTMSLFFQSGYSAVLGLVANLVLTILLSPTIFGIYITTLSIIALLNYFSDFGLAASLIQKKEVEDRDLYTAFTAQQIIIGVLILVGFSATTLVKNFYNLPQEGVYLYWALLAGFFLSSLKTIPSILLERKIQFQKIVIVQICENTIFYLTVTSLALLKFGLFSFTYAVLLRSVVGLILIYVVSFWVPRIGLSLHSLKSLLSFGLPFQASSFLAIFKDDFIMLYLGKVIGFEALGYIGWAKKWAEASVRIIMDNVSKVIFPLIARFQDDKSTVAALAGKMLYYQTFLLTPAIIGMMFVMQDIVNVVPNYQKWQPALTSFYILSLSTLIISFGAPFVNLLNALGKVKTSFLFMLFFTVIMWVFTPFFVRQFGFTGFALSHLIVSISTLLVTYRVKKFLDFSFFSSIYKFLLSAGVMVLSLFALKVFVKAPIVPRIIMTIVIGAGVYFASLKLLGVAFISEAKALYEKKPLDT